MKRSLWVLLVLAFSCVTCATESPVEASMVITGTITVNPDGGVQGYTLHDPDKIPPGVVQIVARTIKAWKFAPVTENGEPIEARAGMAVRVVAEMIDDSHMAIRVADASFGCNSYRASAMIPDACPPDTEVEAVLRQPPRYPEDALRGGAEGEVFLLVDVGRDGRVIHAAAKQVNLYHLTRRDPSAMRNALARAAETAALKWEFKPPTVGPKAGKDHWMLTVPIRYTFAFDNAPGNRRRPDYTNPEYGKWSAYLPGPVQRIPWDDDAKGGAQSVIAGSNPFVPDTRFHLKTTLDHDSGQS